MGIRAFFLLLFALLPGAVTLWAQSFEVRGKVTAADNKEPLIGVNIRQKGTSNGVITDFDGNYRITVQGTEGVLQFSYIGMETVERHVKPGTTPVNVALRDDTKQIEEVVVVAYGTRKKGTITGSVGVVKGEALENTPVVSFDQALQGKATGLTVLSNSGAPDAPASFQIRGTNSINADTEPLFVLDGVPISSSDFSSLNPNDFESISVLKDASSTSIYGARAANGVVVITSKRGRAGEKARVTLRAQYGFSNLAYGNWKQMNTTERLNFEEEIGLRVPGTYDREMLEKTNVNWKDVVFNNDAPTQSYEASVAGGSNVINYYVSAGYMKQEGIAVGSSFERYTMRANIEAQATKWLKIGTNTSLTYSESEEAEYGSYSIFSPISASRFMLPYWSPYKADGSLTSTSDGSWRGTFGNPMEYLEAHPMERNKMQLVSASFVEISPIKDLKLRTMVGVEGGDVRTNTYSFPSYPMNYGIGAVGKSFARLYNLTWTNTATYAFSLQDKHNVNVLLGHEVTKNGSDNFSVVARGQSNDKLMTLTTGTVVPNWSDNRAASTYVSVFARGEYNFRRNYFVDFSVRRDASSKFGKDARWANFWSVGALWDAKHEKFLDKVDWLTTAQLNASYGTSGNSSIPNYDHLALYAAGPKYSGMTGIAPYSRGNEDLTWEKLSTFNIGLKLGFFDRIQLGVEFYNKKTTDMLMEVPVTLGNGTDMEWDNVGAMVNRGVELDVNVTVLKLRDFRWDISANASYNYNEITELYNGLDEYLIPGGTLMLKVGHPYGEHYLVRYAGVNPANGDALWYTKDGQLTNEYNEDDKVLTGKSCEAPWQGGFGTTLSWKGLSLSAQFSWVKNRWMLNNDRWFDESNGLYSSAYNQSKELLYRWRQPGDVTSIPRYGVSPQMDTHLLEDASFLRLKNLMLAYNLPAKWLKKTRVIEQVRLFAQAQNLLTFTKFTGMDPESSLSIYQATYPMSRQFTFGAEVQF